MSLIDWSDPDEMVGLLIEYVEDEAREAGDDRQRAGFLRDLLHELDAVASDLSREGAARALLEIRGAQPREFASDPVLVHLDHCIEELHRISQN